MKIENITTEEIGNYDYKLVQKNLYLAPGRILISNDAGEAAILISEFNSELEDIPFTLDSDDIRCLENAIRDAL